jgi:cation diffusion facilitator CzcD-associated flavoprotein CzcO
MHRIRENFSPSRGARRGMNGANPSAIVIGGGPGGVSAALLLASRGIEVDLFEK